MKRTLTLLAAILCSSSSLASQTPTVVDAINAPPVPEVKHFHSDIIISDQWIRHPTKTSVNTAAYFNIHNGTDVDIKIIDASVEDGICKNTEVHGYKPDDKGVMKMFKLESITIPAKTTVEFKPGSNHIMLMGLQKTIYKTSTYNIKLKLAPASEESKISIPDFNIQFPVR